MDVKLKFLGGAKSVTGSKYLLDIDDTRILVDCGLFQGLKELRLRNWSTLDIDPATIDMVVLTHAHIDHTGYLPKLYKDGFSGPIYCTQASADLVKILLKDSAKLQEEEAEFAAKKGYSKHANPTALYGVEDVEKVLPLLQPVKYGETISLTPKIGLLFQDAGHILGSAIVSLFLQGETQNKKMVFSGDLGRYDTPVMFDPTAVQDADILLVESTYGNRTNQVEDALKELEEIVVEAMEAGGCMVIPAFAVGRTQTLLYFLYQLFEDGRIPKIPVYLDSPMAVSVTNLYENYPEGHKLGDLRSRKGDPIFDYPLFRYVTTKDESKHVNTLKNNAIIISASGMCTGGRILHHLFHRLPQEQDTVVFVGYQGEGTRGRNILDGDSTIKIFGEEVSVRCRIREIKGLSAHADQAELLRWLDNFESAPKRTFIIHGEEKSSKAFAEFIQEKLKWQTIIPDYLESFELFSGI